MNLALCYESGKGVKQDLTLAVKYYQAAAEQGDTLALFSVGLCYQKGQGVKQDMGKALDYFKQAVDKGNAMCQFHLGMCYKRGQGVKPDKGLAMYYFKLAADQEHPNAKHQLDLLHLSSQEHQKISFLLRRNQNLRKRWNTHKNNQPVCCNNI